MAQTMLLTYGIIALAIAVGCAGFHWSRVHSKLSVIGRWVGEQGEVTLGSLLNSTEGPSDHWHAALLVHSPTGLRRVTGMTHCVLDGTAALILESKELHAEEV